MINVGLIEIIYQLWITLSSDRAGKVSNSVKIPYSLRSITLVLAVGTLLIVIACQSSISLTSSNTTPQTPHKSYFTTQTGEKYIWSPVKIGGG